MACVVWAAEHHRANYVRLSNGLGAAWPSNPSERKEVEQLVVSGRGGGGPGG